MKSETTYYLLKEMDEQIVVSVIVNGIGFKERLIQSIEEHLDVTVDEASLNLDGLEEECRYTGWEKLISCTADQDGEEYNRYFTLQKVILY